MSAKQSMLESSQYSKEIIITVIGNPSVGKTALIERYANNRFLSSAYVTVATDYVQTAQMIDNNRVKITIYDIPGSQRYNDVVSHYFKIAHGFLVVYDMSDPQTFHDIKIWMTQMQKFINIKDCSLMLLGNKSDMRQTLDNTVTIEQGAILSSNYKMSFLETSAKNGDKVRLAFQQLIYTIYNKQKLTMDNNNHNDTTKIQLSTKISNQPQPKKEWNCFKRLFSSKKKEDKTKIIQKNNDSFAE